MQTAALNICNQVKIQFRQTSNIHSNWNKLKTATFFTQPSWDLVCVRPETGTLFLREVSPDWVKASRVVLEFDETAENEKNVCFAWRPLSNSPTDSSVLKLCHSWYSFLVSGVRQVGAIQGSVTINDDEIEFINYFFTSIKLITRQSGYNYPTFPLET